MLVLQDVTVSTDDKQILKDVNLDFGPGIHFIVGPNGAGKSTLAHAIMDNPKYTVTNKAYNKWGNNGTPRLSRKSFRSFCTTSI